jgi:hypothetical protein
MHRILFVALAAVLSLLAGCSSVAARDEVHDKADVNPAWNLRGWRVIGCCCTAPCACRINKKPSYCHGCDHTDVVHVEEGEMGGVKMDGVQWAVVGRGFGQGADGNWAYVYVDERISEAQYKALGDWLSAGVAGLGKKAPYLAGNFRGMRKVPMKTTVSRDKHDYGASIPGILDIQTSAIFNPGHTEPVVSTGIMDAFGDRFVHSNTARHTYSDPTLGTEWDLTGRQSNQAEFTIDSTRAAKGGIGWGCWTAHSDFGDEAPYGEQQAAVHEHKP